MFFLSIIQRQDVEILLYICKMYRNLFYNNLFDFEAINSLSCLTLFVCILRPTCCFEHSSDPPRLDPRLDPRVDPSGSTAAPSPRPRWLVEMMAEKMSKAPRLRVRRARRGAATTRPRRPQVLPDFCNPVFCPCSSLTGGSVGLIDLSFSSEDPAGLSSTALLAPARMKARPSDGTVLALC